MSTNFPTSLDSYTTKVDNTDDVLATHVNNLQDAVSAIEAKVGINGSVVTTSFEYFLKHSNGAYRTHTHDGTSDDGAKIPMGSLSEVSIAGLVTGHILKYNGSTSKWENVFLALSNMSDVQLSSLSNGEALVYNTSAGKWINQSLSTYAVLANNQTFNGLCTFAGGLVVENRTSDPGTPATGQLWFRTDL